MEQQGHKLLSLAPRILVHLWLHSFSFNSRRSFFNEKKKFKSDEALMVDKQQRKMVSDVSQWDLFGAQGSHIDSMFLVSVAAQHQFECFRLTCRHSLCSEKSQSEGKYIFS